jgi:hypothetical protein
MCLQGQHAVARSQCVSIYALLAVTGALRHAQKLLEMATLMCCWLREHGCPWDVSEVCSFAAGSGAIDILDYLLEQGAVLSAEALTNALFFTGFSSELQGAQWLRQHGAEWPAVLATDSAVQWSADMIAWARAEGCISPAQ